MESVNPFTTSSMTAMNSAGHTFRPNAVNMSGTMRFLRAGGTEGEDGRRQ